MLKVASGSESLNFIWNTKKKNIQKTCFAYKLLALAVVTIRLWDTCAINKVGDRFGYGKMGVTTLFIEMEIKYF